METETKCKKCGCTPDNPSIHKDGRKCYWPQPDLCSCCREFRFITYKPKNPKSKQLVKQQYFKIEDKLTQQEHDLLYGDLINAWENNSFLNRNRFIQQLLDKSKD